MNFSFAVELAVFISVGVSALASLWGKLKDPVLRALFARIRPLSIIAADLVFFGLAFLLIRTVNTSVLDRLALMLGKGDSTLPLVGFTSRVTEVLFLALFVLIAITQFWDMVRLIIRPEGKNKVE